MNSIIARAAMGLGAAALALGVGTLPASAAESSATPTAAPSTGQSAAVAPGHWQFEGTYTSYHTCTYIQNYYESIDVTARCSYSGGTWKLFIWVLH